MKRVLILFLSILCLSDYAQEDTTSAMETLYKESILINKSKQDSIKRSLRSFGFAMYAGIGQGGNSQKTGIAYGGGAAFHYKIHSINMYASLATKSEPITTQNDLDYTLYSSNYGFMYQVGMYDKNFSISGGAGIGYSRVNMVLQTEGQTISQYHYLPGYVPVFYSKVGACVGFQATAHGKVVGFTMQCNINFSDAINSYTFLGGITFIIDNRLFD